MFVRALASLLVCGLVPALASAEQGPDYGRTGPYLGAEFQVGIFTRAENQFRSVLQTFGQPVPDMRTEASIGGNGRAGYRFHRRFAAEVEFEWTQGPRSKDSNNVKVVNGQSWWVGANGKAYLWPDKRVQPFGLVGLGYMQSSVQFPTLPVNSWIDGGFAIRFGGGFDAYITENLVFIFDTQYVVPTGNISKLDYVSIGLGLGWRF